MRFVKMHGLGNDFVLVDRLKADGAEPAWPDLARAMCHRRLGIGADGLLLVLPSRVGDVRMRMFNPDGSEAEHCGNGIRCLARYAREQHGLGGEELRVETLAGLNRIGFEHGPDGTPLMRVDMGPARLRGLEIPTTLDLERVIDQPLEVEGERLAISAVSMGNPHAIAFLPDEAAVARFPLERLGPQVEHHPLFPARTNFEVAAVLDPHRVRMRVWERGAGITLACGTGACATAVAAMVKGLARSPVTVHLPGGDLRIEWSGTGSVFMTGPATYVFTGEWPTG